jgi:hypothetical protein
VKEITLILTLDELNVVLAGLGKLPLETVFATFSKIKAQAEQQVNEKPE